MRKIKWSKSTSAHGKGNVIGLAIHSGGENRKNFVCTFFMDYTAITKTEYVNFGTSGGRLYLCEAHDTMDGYKVSAKHSPAVSKASDNALVAWLIGKEGKYFVQYDEEEKLHYVEIDAERN